jgi:hypothetical protein
MQILILKSSSGQYDDYQETIEEIWVREESFVWEVLHAEYKRLVKGAMDFNKGRKKDLLPVISLSDFLLANGFSFVPEFNEHLD